MRALLVMVMLVAGCKTNADRERPVRQEQDSVLGASRLPGAAGVRGALRAADSAAARNARLDSVR